MFVELAQHSLPFGFSVVVIILRGIHRIAITRFTLIVNKSQPVNIAPDHRHRLDLYFAGLTQIVGPKEGLSRATPEAVITVIVADQNIVAGDTGNEFITEIIILDKGVIDITDQMPQIDGRL